MTVLNFKMFSWISKAPSLPRSVSNLNWKLSEFVWDLSILTTKSYMYIGGFWRDGARMLEEDRLSHAFETDDLDDLPDGRKLLGKSPSLWLLKTKTKLSVVEDEEVKDSESAFILSSKTVFSCCASKPSISNSLCESAGNVFFFCCEARNWSSTAFYFEFARNVHDMLFLDVD